MSVSIPGDLDSINCTVIELYTQSAFLKLTMITQGMAGIVSMLSILLTLKKIFTTAMVDTAFKEYLLACFAMQFLHAISITILQSILLTTHLISAPCEAYISARLCYSLRIMVASLSALPYLNAALTVFRFFVLHNNTSSRWRESLWMFRGFQLVAILIGVCFQIYKFHAVNMDGYVVYCIGNFKGISTQLEHESIATAFCEGFSIVFSALLFRSYKKSHRSFEVNCSLLRRQAIQTFHLFIWFSFIQATAFWSVAGLAALYRSHFGTLAEPQYSAGSGLLYIPMYYTMVSPWLVYCILRREEKKRVRTMNDLLARENNGTHEYFKMIKLQWENSLNSTKYDQTTNFFDFLRQKRNSIRPVKEITDVSG